MDSTRKVRLEGWKEVADYLDQHERTVQRWEKERRLPVYHTPGKKRGMVYAYTAEIDQWLEGQASVNEKENSTPQPSNHDLHPVTADPPQRVPTRQFRQWSVRALILLSICALSVIAIIGFERMRPGQLARAEISENSIKALDKDGKLLWRVVVPQKIWFPVSPEYRVDDYKLAQVVELRGDGRKHVLVLLRTSPGGSSGDRVDELDCYSSDGRLEWKYSPAYSISFAGRTFESPWDIFDILITGEARKTIWLAVGHKTWWPSFVVRIDPDGHAETQFTNSGLIFRLASARMPSGEKILAGAYNNEYAVGSLALIDPARPPVSSPQRSGSEFICDICPRGDPEAYFLFPRTELSVTTAAQINPVWRITVRADSIEVTTKETLAGDSRVYEFRLDDSLQHFTTALSTGYWLRHEQLEREGKILHPVRKCPEQRNPPLVRSWQNRAWRTLRPDATFARN